MAHAIASFASTHFAPKGVTIHRVGRVTGAPRRLTIVHGKKGAWAKEFDPEYDDGKTPVEVDDGSDWPGLDSTCNSYAFTVYI